MLGDKLYAEMKKACDDYFYIPARREHRGVGGIFFDRLQDASLGGHAGSAEMLARAVATEWMPSYLPIVRRRKAQEASEEMRQWQLLRRGRYVEFNLLYDRGVRFGLAQLEKVMVSAPPLVAWQYNSPAKGMPAAADEHLLEVLARPVDWGFDSDEGELVEFLANPRGDSQPRVGGILPRPIVQELNLSFHGIGVLVLESASTSGQARILCHRRSPTKATYPGRWDMLVGGTNKPRETSLAAATRELQEELGLKVATDGQLLPLDLACEVRTEAVVACCEVFVCSVKPGFSAKLQDEEVAEVAWRSVEDVRQAVAEEPTSWVESGLQVWTKLEASGGFERAVSLCAKTG
eukprot:TRINITY_DN30917_c0_g1_i1.p1 TRINITY_DN30917_c0_g1~~TRINITY_DN30917_c0_g1_i1.p1  ORF type:complete len:397 (-),score=87.49 TRINITY_DN30917_c0_g1_i1:2-1048(-)